MSFLKKLGQTAMSTASTIGAKSADLMEMGKLKMAKSQLEGKIKEAKTEIGHLAYTAYRDGTEPDGAAWTGKMQEVADLEKQIREVEEKMEQAKAKDSSSTGAAQTAAPAASAGGKFCANCGASLDAEVRFCTNCGTPVA
ncbi:MAG: zinc-ribbon domain-containing protein [bacterium]|jgi:hypothetical protein